MKSLFYSILGLFIISFTSSCTRIDQGHVGLKRDLAGGSKGDIGIVTRGMAANDSYTMVIEMRKDNQHYQRGQFNDPAAFNYGSYGVRP